MDIDEQVCLFISERSNAQVNEWLSLLMETKMAERALRALRNRMIGNEAFRQWLMKKEPRLIEMLDSFVKNRELREEALIVLGSLAWSTDPSTKNRLKNIVGTLITVAREDRCESALRVLSVICKRQENAVGFDGQSLEYLLECLHGRVLFSPLGKSRSQEYAANILASCSRKKILERGALEGALSVLSLNCEEAPISQMEAALALLASLTVAIEKEQVEQMDERLLGLLFALLKEDKERRSVDVRLLAATILVNLSPFIARDERIAQQLVPMLCSLLEQGNIGVKAAQLLACLVAGNEGLQIVACEEEAVTRLVHLIAVEDEEKDEEALSAMLMALAVLASLREDCRRKVIEAPYLLNKLVLLLKAKKAVLPTCQLIRSLSRSVRSLRTTILDAGLVPLVLTLLKDEVRQESPLLISLCAVLCNLVLDFSPVKTLIANDTILLSKLVRLACSSSSSELKSNILWALKNLLYLADPTIKAALLGQFNPQELISLLNDMDSSVQEQALTMLRNLACEGETDITILLDFFDPNDKDLSLQKLFSLLEEKLHSSLPNAVQACYILANICTAKDPRPRDSLLSNQGILQWLVDQLASSERELMLAILWTVINLTWSDETASGLSCMQRVQILRQFGVEPQLAALLKNPDLPPDILDRVNTALENFQNENANRRTSSNPNGTRRRNSNTNQIN